MDPKQLNRDEITRTQTRTTDFFRERGIGKRGKGDSASYPGRWSKRKRSTKNSLGKDVDPERAPVSPWCSSLFLAWMAPYIWRKKRRGIYRREEEDARSVRGFLLAPLFLFSVSFGRKAH